MGKFGPAHKKGRQCEGTPYLKVKDWSDVSINKGMAGVTGI